MWKTGKKKTVLLLTITRQTKYVHLIHHWPQYAPAMVPRIGIHECRADRLNGNNVRIYYRRTTQTRLEELSGDSKREIENMPLGGRLLPFPPSRSRSAVRSRELRRQRPTSRASTVYNNNTASSSSSSPQRNGDRRRDTDDYVIRFLFDRKEIAAV